MDGRKYRWGVAGYLMDPRRFNALTFVAAALGWGIALVDAADWVWLPLLLPLSVFALRVAEPRIPAWTILVVAVPVVAAVNIDLDAEGAFFLLCMGAFAVTAEDCRWVPSRALVVGAALSPLIDVAAAQPAVRDWNWPFWSMGVAVSGFFGAVLAEQRRAALALADAQLQLATQAAGEERRRIAREVHDLVGHSLTVVLLHVTGARRLVRRDPDEAERALADAERAGRGALADIRRTVALLRDDGGGGGEDRAPTPTAVDLETLVADSRGAGMDIVSSIVGDVDDVDETTGLVVYRIVQEALANAARHAPGARTVVDIGITRERVCVEVRDDGPSRPPAVATGEAGIGLIGMEERASALGGTLVAGPRGQGWRVRATLPRSPAPELESTP